MIPNSVLEAISLWFLMPKNNLPIFNAAAAAKSLQSCLTLCDPIDCSLPGSSVHGLQKFIVPHQNLCFSSSWSQFQCDISFLVRIWLTQMVKRGHQWSFRCPLSAPSKKSQALQRDMKDFKDKDKHLILSGAREMERIKRLEEAHV